MTDFVHLHLHTEYSLLDGACRIGPLMSRVAEYGQKAVAITDHGVMYGAVEFYKAAKKAGVKPIIGCEMYVAPRTRFDRDSRLDRENYHLVLLAENEEGYRNLIKLSSASFTEGFYGKPRVDLDLLERHSRGLIALSACLGGRIPRYILDGDFGAAEEYAARLIDLFGRENFFLELQNHQITEQKIVNSALVQIAKKTGARLVATNDVHYLDRSDAQSHAVLMCIQMNQVLEDKRPLGFESDEFYLKSADEMAALFSSYEGALENTVRIAERCCFDFRFGRLFLPAYRNEEGTDNRQYLREKCREGLERILKGIPQQAHAEYESRLAYELDVILQMGFCEYFLIVADFVSYAKERGIAVGPGRGSGAGSLCAYCLGITGIDPIRYRLLFERFLNPERVSMPDFDIDFCYERRHEVIEYVTRKYGEDHVCQIITFNTMAARAVVRDVGRALGMPYGEVDEIARLVPRSLDMTLEKALSQTRELAELYNAEPRVKKLIDIAKTLEGMPRHASVHAAGVVVTDRPLTDYVPLAENGGSIVTQYSMNEIADIGLLKIDFLGLRYLSILQETVRLVRERNPDFDIGAADRQDKDVYRMIARGETVGLFQLESAGMRSLLMRLEPESIEDITAVIALYRPGPMDSIPAFLKNRKQKDSISYDPPVLREILSVTNGCIVYQEQVMQIFRALAGYSYGRADIVRRAMSKKDAGVMENERQYFLYGKRDENGQVECEGCIARGIKKETAEKIFDDMADFAKYAFNKSHAAAYSHITYHTAFLKYHYPKEFMASLLTSQLGDDSKVAFYIAECARMGIRVLPPDINESMTGFTVSGDSIRFGLLGVKNVGINWVRTVFAEREKGRFDSFSDFIFRMSSGELNKRMVESLIKCGAFDSFGHRRSVLLAVYEKAIDAAHETQRKNLSGQMDLFSHEQKSAGELTLAYPDLPELPKTELLALEKSVTGIYLSGNPLYEYSDASLNTVPLIELPELLESGRLKERETVNLLGFVGSKKIKMTRTGEEMAFVSLEDLSGKAEIVVFPRIYEAYKSLLREGAIVLVTGEVTQKDDEVGILAGSFRVPGKKAAPEKKALPDKPAAPESTGADPARGETNIYSLYLRIGQKDDKIIKKISALISIFEGDSDVFVYFARENKKYKISGKILVNDYTIRELKNILGEEHVVLETKRKERQTDAGQQ